MNKEKKNTEREKEIQRGKKRYQERLVEEQEANKLIRDYTPQEALEEMVKDAEEMGLYDDIKPL